MNNNTGFSQVIAEFDSSNNLLVSYTYGDDLITQNRSGNISFYHYDGLGSTRVLTDATGATTDTYTYDAFGNLVAQTGKTPNSYLFAGEQYDPNVGFYYLRARLYNPAIGRFLTTDAFRGSIYDPISLHKYLYAGLDPFNKTGPSGESNYLELLTSSAIIKILAAILVGAILYRLLRPGWQVSNATRITGGTSYYYYLLAALKVIKDNSYTKAYSEVFQMYGEGRLYVGNISAPEKKAWGLYDHVKGRIYIDSRLVSGNRNSAVVPESTEQQGLEAWYQVDVRLASVLIHELAHREHPLAPHNWVMTVQLQFIKTVYVNEQVEWRKQVLERLLKEVQAEL